jgi:hypothetical protein
MYFLKGNRSIQQKYTNKTKEGCDTMTKKTQYQPTQENGHTVTSAQEVVFSKDFKTADIAGGYRKEKVRKAKKENPNLL